MTELEQIYQRIKDGSIQLPEEIQALPEAKLRAILESLLVFFDTSDDLQNRSPRSEILQASQFFLSHDDSEPVADEPEIISVFLVNLSTTGALIMLRNTENYPDLLYHSGELLIPLSDTIDSDLPDIKMQCKIVRKEEGQDGNFFYGVHFTEMDDLQEQMLLEQIDTVNE